jgi:hypothetical protein
MTARSIVSNAQSFFLAAGVVDGFLPGPIVGLEQDFDWRYPNSIYPIFALAAPFLYNGIYTIFELSKGQVHGESILAQDRHLSSHFATPIP